MTVRPRDLIALCVVAFLVAGYGFERFVLKPAHHQATALQAQIATQRATLAQAQQRYAAGRDAAVAVRRLGPSWRASHEAIPKTSNIPGLLRLLQSQTGSVAVGIHEIAVGQSSSSSTAASPTSTSVTPSTAGQPNPVPVSFTFQGGYQRLNRLVRRLDALVELDHGRISAHGPFVGISQVSLAPGQGGLTFQLTATLYQHGPASSALGSSTTGTTS